MPNAKPSRGAIAVFAFCIWHFAFLSSLSCLDADLEHSQAKPPRIRGAFRLTGQIHLVGLDRDGAAALGEDVARYLQPPREVAVRAEDGELPRAGADGHGRSRREILQR